MNAVLTPHFLPLSLSFSFFLSLSLSLSLISIPFFPLSRHRFEAIGRSRSMSLLYLWRARPRDASERTRVIDAATEPSAKRERGRKPTQNCRPRRHPIYPARRHSHATDIIVPVEISACRACSSSSRVPRVVNALSPRKPRQINRAMFRQLLFSNCANTNLPQSKQRRGERRLVEGRDH